MVRLCNRLPPGVYIFFLAFVSYATTLRNGFALDDSTITKGEYPSNLGDCIHLLWEPVAHGSSLHYRPLTYLSFVLDEIIWGKNPFGFHLTNIVLAAATATAAFFFLQGFLDKQRAFVAATTFVVLPGHSEAIIGCFNRSQVLASFFLFCALLSFQRGIKNDKCASLYLLLSGACTILSCTSKEIGLLIPFLGLPWLFWARHKKRVCAGLTAQGFACLFYLALRHHAQGTFGMYNAEGFLVGSSWSEHYFTSSHTFWMYLKLACFPTNLSCDYPSIIWSFSWAGIALPLGGVWLLLRFKQNRTVLYFAYWFVVLLVPGLHLIPIQVAFAERLLYPASLAICVGLSLILHKLKNGRQWWFLILVLCPFLVASNARHWECNEALWSQALRVNPKSYRGLTFLANQEAREGDFEESARLYHKALSCQPNKVNRQLIYWNLTATHSGKKSKTYLQELPELDPDYPPAMLALGKAHHAKQNWSLARKYLSKVPKPRNRWDKQYLEVQHMLEKLDEKGDYPDVHRNATL